MQKMSEISLYLRLSSSFPPLLLHSIFSFSLSFRLLAGPFPFPFSLFLLPLLIHPCSSLSVFFRSFLPSCLALQFALSVSWFLSPSLRCCCFLLFCPFFLPSLFPFFLSLKCLFKENPLEVMAEGCNRSRFF